MHVDHRAPGAADQPAIRFDQVSKRFTFTPDHPYTVLELLIRMARRQHRPSAELWAVRQADFTIMPGETVGFVGRNGSGKSTILKLANRILEPTHGSVTVNGRASALLELGAGFHPDLTGRENVYLNGALLGLQKEDIAARFDDIVAFSELDSFIHMPVKHYSSGMYMRLAFSVAVHVDPNVLFIDEILAVGDQAFQNKCIDRIYDIKQAGTTIVIVSHDLRVIQNLCSRVIWVDQGEIRADGRPEQVVADYAAYSREREVAQLASQSSGRADFPRWGSGEVAITGVRLLNGQAQPSARYRTGDPLTVEISYQADTAVDAPRFAVSFFRRDGLQVNNPSSELAGLAIDRVVGAGRICYHVEHLPLLPAFYAVSVSVHDAKGLKAYDYHDRAYTFTVEAGDSGERTGVLQMPGRWHWQPGA